MDNKSQPPSKRFGVLPLLRVRLRRTLSPATWRALRALMLVTCLPVSQVLVAHEVAAPGSASPESTTPWGGDYFPNTLLTDQDGRQLHFFDDLIRDKVVVINFIFITCSDSCPLETARLRQVQKLLGDRVGQDIFFYSISIDPLSDTPEVLKAYAQRFKVGPGWKFLTGELAEVTDLRKKLGLFIEGVDNGRSKDHNLSLIVSNHWRFNPDSG